MLKLFALNIILLLIVCAQQANAQCLSTPQVLDSLTSIKDSEHAPAQKIVQLQAMKQSFEKCHKIKDSVYARIVHRLGDMYGQVHDYPNALRFTKEAITINSANNKYAEKAFLAHSYLNMGLFYERSLLPQESLGYFNSCIQVSKQFPAKYFITSLALIQKSYVLFQMGDFQKSIDVADDGILFARSLKDTLKEVPLLSRKAQAETELNNLVEAEKNINKAISILNQHPPDTNQLAIVYTVYANLLNEKGDTLGAIKYYNKALRLNEAKEKWVECSRNLLNLGYIYDKKFRQSAKAINCYKKGIEMLDKSEDTYQRVALFLNWGVVYWREKKFLQALNFYQQALNALPIHFSDTAIKSNPALSALKLVANDYFVSTLLANKGESLLGQYKVGKKAEVLQAALTTFQVADESVDLMRWKQYGEQSKLFWRGKTKQMYEQAIEACYLSNDIEKGLYFFEKSRAVLLNDKLSELGAKKFISHPDRLLEQQLRIKISSCSQQLSYLDVSAGQYNNKRQELFAAEEELEKFLKGLEQKYPVYYQYKYNSDVVSLTEIKINLLEKNQSLIEYFTTDSSVYVLFISHTTNRFIKIAFPDYSAVTKEMMKLCSDKSLNQNYTRYRALSNYVYEKLFKPLNVPEGRVIISPDEYFIPFEALLSDSSIPTSFLLNKYAFSYTYSAGLLLKSEKQSTAGNSFLGLAPINFSPALGQQSLYGSDKSLTNIKSYFHNSSILLDDKASKQGFLKNFSLFNIVQIYSHADADSANKQPVLYFNDSALNISEIQNIEDLQTELIVLSACKTGFGKHAKGEGIFSLARAFMAAGIPSTITTLWQVDNNSTYELTENFYKFLSEGLPKDVALQKAKLQFLQSGDRTKELPYYWAASILLGKTDIIPKESPPGKMRTTLIAVTAGLVLLGFLVFFFKKFSRFTTRKSRS